jgi:hypothetical protein
MGFNVALEGLAGMIPFAGDVFDAAFKANLRNVRLLDRYLEHPRQARRASRLFVAGLCLAVVGMLVATAAAAFLVVRWIGGLF